jgi:hypothetical protein
VAIFWPSSVGSGAYPSGGRLCPQRGHLISSDIGLFHLARIIAEFEEIWSAATCRRFLSIKRAQ